MHDVIVVGGGISGLSCAWHMAEAGLDVSLIEAQSSVGGCMQTQHRDGFLLEKGPFNVIVRDPSFQELLTAIGDQVQVVAASKDARSRYLYRNGTLMAVPTNPIALATSGLLSTGGKLRAIRGLLLSERGSGEETTIGECAMRRFGRDVTDTMVSAVVSGILAGDIDKLSLDACAPKIARMDREARSLLAFGVSKMLGMFSRKKDGKPRRKWRGLVSIDQGLGAVADALAARLGAGLVTGQRVISIARDSDWFSVTGQDNSGQEHVHQARRVVLAVPITALGTLLEPLAPGTTAIASSIDNAALTVLNLVFKREDVGHPLRGFGFLVPRNQLDIPVMGVLFADSAFPHHATPEHRLIRVFVGGIRTPDVISRSDDELVATSVGSLRDLLKIRGEPTMIDVCPYPTAIPQYHVGHLDKIAQLRKLVAPIDGLDLVGNYLEGVSVNDCVRVGKQVAGEVVVGARRDAPVNKPQSTLAAAS